MKKTSSENSKEKTKAKDKGIPKEQQINMGLRYSRLEFLYKLKRMARRVEKDYTVLPFWQNALIWAAIISVFCVSIIAFILIRKNYSSLPPEIPLIFDLQEENWKSYPKVYIFSVPVVLILTGFINIQVLKKVYYMNKNMTLMICFLIVLTSLLSLAALNEIILLTTR